jgi:RNA polymerase sigma-70 factor (ECF subfamily)
MLDLQIPRPAAPAYNPVGPVTRKGRSTIARPLAPEDAELLARCIRRSPGAWEDFLRRYRPVLERAARGTLARAMGAAPEDDVEAVVEAALLALVKDDHASLRSFTGRSSLAGYLHAVTSKIALNHVRGERRKGWLRFRPLDLEVEAPPAEVREDAPGQLAALRRALRELPSRDRLLLELFHLDGASYREIASLVRLSFNAVSPALIRARERLRALLQRER